MGKKKGCVKGRGVELEVTIKEGNDTLDRLKIKDVTGWDMIRKKVFN